MTQKVSDTEALLYDLEHVTHNLNETGLKFNVSRERVRQIFKAKRGYAWGKDKKVFSKKVQAEREAARQKFLDTIKFRCKACNKPVPYRINNSVFCESCHNIWLIENRDPRIIIKCQTCGINFHPIRNWRFVNNKLIPRFHSKECYMASSDFSLRLGGHTVYPDDVLIEKMKEYYLKNGHFPITGRRTTFSDFSPCYGTYYRRFGKYENVKQKVLKSLQNDTVGA